MSQESIPCADRSSLDLALRTGCTKPLTGRSLRVPSEDDSTGGEVEGNNPRIKDPIILTPRRETSNTPSGSTVDSLEVLLSNLHLDKHKPELPATDPEPITKRMPPKASLESEPRLSSLTTLAICKDPSSLSSDAPIRPITGSATGRGPGFPYSVEQRAAFDDLVFTFDSNINMSTSPGSLISDREVTQFNFGSLPSIEENSWMTSYPQAYNTLQQQTPVDLQQAPFQFTSFAPSNTMPGNNRMTLLSHHFKGQGYVQTYSSPIATSPVMNQGSFPHSAGEPPRSPIHHFMSSSLNTNDRDQYMPLKFDDDLELLLLSPGPEVTSPTSGWSFDQSRVHSKPIGILPTDNPNGRGGSLSNSVRPQHHPYRSASYGGAAESVFLPGNSSVDDAVKNFPPHQQQAALSIFNYKQAHPDTAIPASFITNDLAEVFEGRGWCLLGNCEADRAKQRLNPHYDSSKDNNRKRLDHLYDHIRDKHFNCRPFRCAMAPCAQTFSREHDLKRHEKTHTAASLPCDVCGKHYTRDDNLKRHQQLKHFSVPGTSRGFGSASFP